MLSNSNLHFDPAGSVVEAALAHTRTTTKAEEFDHINGYLALDDVISRAEDYLSVVDGAVSLDSQAAEAAGIAPRDINFLENGIRILNAMTADGQVSAQEGNNGGVLVQGLTALFEDITIVDVTINGLQYTIVREVKWWGTRYCLSSPMTTKLVQAMGVVAGVGALVSAIKAAATPATGGTSLPCGAVTAIASAAIALGAALIAFMDFGKGIYINFPWGSVVPTISPVF